VAPRGWLCADVGAGLDFSVFGSAPMVLRILENSFRSIMVEFESVNVFALSKLCNHGC